MFWIHNLPSMGVRKRVPLYVFCQHNPAPRYQCGIFVFRSVGSLSIPTAFLLLLLVIWFLQHPTVDCGVELLRLVLDHFVEVVGWFGGVILHSRECFFEFFLAGLVVLVNLPLVVIDLGETTDGEWSIHCIRLQLFWVLGIHIHSCRERKVAGRTRLFEDRGPSPP